jgi:hypothetical protein
VNDPVAAALEQVTFVGVEPPSRPGPDPAVLEGLRAAAQAALVAAAEPEPAELGELVSVGSPLLRVNLDFVALLRLVPEERAFEILAKLKEATTDA